MSTVWWRFWEDKKDTETMVTDQHGLPVTPFVRPDETLDAEEVTKVNQMPVQDYRLVRARPQVPQVSVSASSVTLIVPENKERKQVKITNITGTQAMYIGTLVALTTGNGDYLAAPAGSNVTYDSVDALYGLAVTSAQTVGIFQTEYSIG